MDPSAIPPIAVTGSSEIIESLADCVDNKKTGGYGDFIFNFVDAYDYFGDESRTEAFVNPGLKAALIRRYDALFGNIDDPNTKDFVGRHVCWKSNPLKLLKAYTSFKLKPFDEANSNSFGTKNN